MHVSHAPVVDRKLRFALAGCGRIALNHWEAIHHHADNVELVAACDPNPAALGAMVARSGAIGFASYAQMLASAASLGGIDCVVLTTPSGLHPQQAIDAAKAGLHVMTEKPMATRWADGLAMVKACDDASVRLFVVKQNRSNRTLQLLRQAIHAGRFGRIYSANATVRWTRPQEYYSAESWRGDLR